MQKQFIDVQLEEEILESDISIDENFSGTLSKEYRILLEKQYKKWSKEEVEIDVTSEQVKEALLKDLSFLCTMSVEEYTLYRKWDEIYNRKWDYKKGYENAANHFYSTFDHSPSAQILEIKNNIWFPSSTDDYKQLQPRVIWAANNPETTNIWNIIRTFTHTQINNSNIGRNLYFIVDDAVTKKYLGIIAMSSDFMDLTPRDSYIGWSREIKTAKRMINHTSIASTICPTQPLGFNYVGGKLIALLSISDIVENTWNTVYKDKLVGVTTTSLYSSFSQYQNLSYWAKRGHSSGSIKFEPSKKTLEFAKKYMRKMWPRKYWEWYEATEPQGMPLKRDFKQRSLAFLYSKLKIEKSYYETNHQRGIYFCPLFKNTNEYLRMEIDENKLEKRFDNSVENLVSIWKEKYAEKRIKSLLEKNKVNNDTLFYNDVINMTWEQTKTKYLKEVGR